jgi:DNA-binding CsgD family transcriptional regulator
MVRVLESAAARPPQVAEMAPAADLSALRERRELLIRRIRHSTGKKRALVAALEELYDLDSELHGADEREQRGCIETLAEISQAIQRLSTVEGPAELIRAAPAELCAACKFTRAMISRVRGSLWTPEVLHIVEGADTQGGAAFKSFVENADIPLAHMLLETDLVRRRIPALVSEPATDPRTYKGLVEVSRTTSFVATPIMPTRRVIGFMHADRYGGSDVDEIDRENIWIFAEHFGLLFERAVLIDRLTRQRGALRSAFATAAAQVDEIVTSDIELTRNEAPTEASLSTMYTNDSSRLAALLTAREREVLELMASGATNALIASQLVVSEGTVKSHVKRILRKLHVGNRAAAVSRYMHLTGLPSQQHHGHNGER